MSRVYAWMPLALALSAFAAATTVSTPGLLRLVVGIIIASLVNLFFRNDTISRVTTCAGVIVFAGLAACDSQKIKAMGAQGGIGGDAAGKVAVSGALALSLGFVNLFLMLLRLLGRRRDG